MDTTVPTGAAPNGAAGLSAEERETFRQNSAAVEALMKKPLRPISFHSISTDRVLVLNKPDA